jgi:hypothetical protein
MAVRQQRVSVIVRTFVALSISVASAGELPPEVEELGVQRPSALTPGCTTLVLEADPPGYYVSTLVTRYFDDEEIADLRVELELTARQQFLRFMAAGRSNDTEALSTGVSGFRSLGMWWDGNALRGLYLVPIQGLASIGAGATAKPNSRETTGLSAAEMLLKARALRRQRDFPAARNALEQLRKEFPLSPEARRALREIYFVNTAQNQTHTDDAGER